MLLCRVTLGKSFLQFSAMKMAHAPPGHHSVIGRPSTNGLTYAEYVVYRGEQVCLDCFTLFPCVALLAVIANSPYGVNRMMAWTLVKSSPMLDYKHWAQSWSQFLGSKPASDISHKPSGRLPLLSTRPAVTFPARVHPFAGTKLHCLVTEAHRCKQLAQGHYAVVLNQD